MTTPTPGQPLSEADVSLLQPGDWLRDSARRLCRFDHLMRPDYIWARIGQGSSCGGGAESFTFLGRPDQDGWIAWNGGENPVPGQMVEVVMRADEKRAGLHGPAELSDGYLWTHLKSSGLIGYGDIIAYRIVPHAPVSRPGDGGQDLAPLTDDPAVDALCASNYRAGALAGWNAAQHDDPVEANRIMARIRSVEPGALAPIIERNRRRAALTPPAEPVSRPAGEGEREAVARIIADHIAGGFDTALQDKQEWKDRHGLGYDCEPLDVNGPFKDDYLAAADAILSLLSPAAPDAGGGS